MQKPKPTAVDYFRKAMTVRWWNFLLWLFMFGTLLFGMFKALYDYFQESYAFLKETYKENYRLHYDWKSEQWLTRYEYLDALAEDIKQKDAQDAVNEAFKFARRWGLEAEVVYSSLSLIKEDPTLSLHDAIILGLREWDIN
jgi:hypothetical protein